MKICFAGLGSIGKRHLKNITCLLNKRNCDFQIDALRSGSRPLDAAKDALIHRQFYHLDDLPADYDIGFICNPTCLHYETIRIMSAKCRHLYIEKPLFSGCDVSPEALLPEAGRIFYVAAPLRHTDVIRYLKEFTARTPVFAARVICSSFLPDWRPGTRYQDVYSAHADQGGGVALDLIHEWDYLRYLFGDPQQVLSLRGKYSELELDSEDVALYIAKYQKMLVSVQLDYFGRSPARNIELYTEDDIVVGDLIQNEVRWKRTNRSVKVQESRDDFQTRELAHFLNIIDGKEKNDNDMIFAFQTLQIAKGV